MLESAGLNALEELLFYWAWAEKIAMHTMSMKEIGYGKSVTENWRYFRFSPIDVVSPSGDFCQVS